MRRRAGAFTLMAALAAVTALILASLALASPAAHAGVAPGPACSGSAFSWTGMGDGTTWSMAKNWNPNGVPGTCDSVTIPIEANITKVPPVDLADLTVPASAGSDGTLAGGPITVSGHFEWDGSTFSATINLPAGSTATIGGPGVIKGLGSGLLGVPGRLNVAGSLTLDNSGATAGGIAGKLGIGAGSGRGVIDIQRTGSLTATGYNVIAGVSCCGGTNTPTLLNSGQIRVASGQLIVTAVVVDQSARLNVASHSLFDVGSPVTLGGGSSYTGAGRMLLDLGSFPSTIAGTLNLGRGFSLELGPQACLDGAGTITGPGAFVFTGGNLPARLTIAKGALMHVTGPGSKDLSTFACGTAAGDITDSGRMVVDQGSLSLGGTGSITTTKGGVLAIAPGVTISSGKLLSNAGTIQLASPAAHVRPGTPVTIMVPLTNAGTVAVGQGLIKVESSYKQQRGGKLAITIAGRTPGTGFGQLIVNEGATLAGTLQLTVGRGFTPRRGQSFNFLKYASRAGRFSTLAGLPRYTVSYGRAGANAIYH